MGISKPSRKEKEKACLACIVQCNHYLKNKIPSYTPKLHKIHRRYRADTSLIYQYCMYYDPTKILDNKDNHE